VALTVAPTAPAPSSLLGGAPKIQAAISRTVLLRDPPAPGAGVEEAALGALERHAARLAPREWVQSLNTRDARRIPSGTVVRFEQESRGVPVLGGGAVVLVGDDGSVSYASVRALPGLPEGASTTPAVGAQEARAAAMADFDHADGVTSRSPGLFVVQDGTVPALAWVVPVATAMPFGSHLVEVDAGTAEVLTSRDVLQSVTGHGLVFHPNPVATSGNVGLRDDFDRSTAELAQHLIGVELEDLDGSGFLRGPLLDVVTGDGTERVSSPTLDFSFARDNPGFEQTMCYAYLQLALAYAGALGHPNPLETQRRVHARFSEGDDEVVNAFFDPVSGFLFFGTRGVDLAEDGTVILHELGHALQDAAASTEFNKFGSNHEGGSMGEGFGDFWALSVLADMIVHEPTSLAHWVAYGDLDYPFGDQLFPAVHRRVDTAKVWPRDADPGRDIHLDGEIWSAALWQIRGLLGRDDANRLVLDSHYLLLPDARFQDGSLALIAANQALFGGAREDEIKAILAGRGVYDPDGTGGDDFLEENDEPIAASDVLQGQAGVQIEDLVCSDDDWYWLPVPAGQVLDVGIQFVHQNGDLDLGLVVLDPFTLELLLVATSTSQENLEEIVADTRGELQALADEDGMVNFFALVQGFEGAANDYDFAAQVVNPGTGQTVTELELGDSFEGIMQPADVDVVEFDGLEGMLLTIMTIKKGRTGAQVDAELWNENGQLSSFGTGLSPRGVRQRLALPATGRYALLLRGAGGSTGTYMLRLIGKPPRVRANETVTFANDQEFAFFGVDALAGSRVILRALPKGRNPDRTRLTPAIYLFDGEGNLLGSNTAGLKPLALLDQTVPESGTYYAAVGPAPGTYGTARLIGTLRLPRSKRIVRELVE
jgi:hypothetical protein